MNLGSAFKGSEPACYLFAKNIAKISMTITIPKMSSRLA
jgi:hypothetical protein